MRGPCPSRLAAFLLTAGIALGAAVPAVSGQLKRAQSEGREPIDRERFLLRPRVLQVELSPDGERVAYLLREEAGTGHRRTSLWILDPARGARVRRLESRMVDRLEWAGDGRGLFLEAGQHLAYLPRDVGRPSFLLRLDPLREQQFRGADPTHPRHLLVTEKAGEGDFRLLRIGPSSPAEVVFRSPKPIYSFLLGGGGRVAYLGVPDRSPGGKPELVLYRRRGSEAGDGAFGDPGEEIYRCDAFRACGLLAVAPDGRLLLLARPEADLWKLASLDPESGRREVLHGDPEGLADLDEVVLDPLDGSPLLAAYDSDGRRNYGLTPEARTHLGHLRRQLPEGNLEVDARSPDRPYWLVTDTAPTVQPRRFYLYDTRRHRVEPILEEERGSVELLPDGLAVGKRHLSYRASDGRAVHGFLSLPRVEDLSAAPLVARIHGGPWNHVRQGFDPVTQFLVSRGYAVFEPNFRASTGYGLEYVLAAKGEFGDGRVHRDIVDGVEHLLDQGIGDPERVAILGHSFGGFSALGAVAFSPELFRAGIATAPAIDLLRSLEDVGEDTTLANGLPQRDLLMSFVVDEEDEAAVERLRRASPEARLADTARPLLIMAGAQDEKIPLVDVKHYALVLDELGRDVSLLVDEDSGHSFQKPLLRRAYAYLVERFLARHLGGAVQERADPEVEEYLKSRLLLVGESLGGDPRG